MGLYKHKGKGEEAKLGLELLNGKSGKLNRQENFAKGILKAHHVVLFGL